MKIILLIIMGISILNADYTKNGDIVIDSLSGVQWQDDISDHLMTWENAIPYCETLILGGHSDWRLPNINELQSIVDRSEINPAIAAGFTNTSTNAYYAYWTSTTLETLKDYTWVIYFSSGYVNYTGKKYERNVRCIRNGQ